MENRWVSRNCPWRNCPWKKGGCPVIDAVIGVRYFVGRRSIPAVAFEVLSQEHSVFRRDRTLSRRLLFED